MFGDLSNKLPLGLECLQRDIPSYCGSSNCSTPVTASDGIVYETDNANLSSASYYGYPVKWGISISVCIFTEILWFRSSEWKLLHNASIL
ncbi:hypothetical protein ZIOFF_040334 [Zingiber officinale]|uniref:Uncharacterized protein n=1 Tax=Zingiber officinale TaxID=94328 RepID=A0A8J5G8N3_ZINOF|nr:hypothetical protein ZIOFF_040334 [Zingiber officinale]